MCLYLTYLNLSTIKTLLVRNKTCVETVAGVHKIPCKDCELVYIDETGSDLDIRIKEHKYSVRTANENNAIAKHVWDKNHCIDWANGQLLYKTNDSKTRKIIVSLYIKNTITLTLVKARIN